MRTHTLSSISHCARYATELARRTMAGARIHAREIDVHFSLPKRNDPDNPEDENTGTMCACCVLSSRPLTCVRA
jgi:hypothetical protein